MPPSTTPAGADSPSPALALLVAAAFFMEMLDATIIITAIPQIAASFEVPPVSLSIGISAYLVTVATFIPLSAWVAERFGARRVFTLALALFALASLACALSQNLAQFTFARILQGIGGALMVPVGRLTVLRRYPKRELMKAIAIITWPGLTAPVLGPPLGGLITLHLSWHWIFLINLPIAAVGICLSLRLMPARASAAPAAPFDLPGFILCAFACLLLMSAVEGLAHLDGGRLAMLAVGAGGIAAGVFAVRHLKRHPHPLVALTPLAHPSFRVALLSGGLFRLSINTMPFLLPLMFQLSFGMDAFQAGLMLLALFAGNLCMKPLTSRVLSAIGFRRVLIINGVIQAASMAACALFTPEVPLALLIVILFLSGMSRSMQFTAFNTLAFSEMPSTKMGSASTLFSTSDQLSTGLGIATAALALQLFQALAGHDRPLIEDFHFALLGSAAIALVATFGPLRLAPEAGAEVARRGR